MAQKRNRNRDSNWYRKNYPKQEKIDKILQALEYGDYDQIEQILEKLIAKNINFIPFKTKIDKFISNFADKKLKEFLKIR